jgi:hypothetical protein
LRPAACAALLLVLTGCAAPVGRVTGKVTWKGQPVAGAELAFHPEKDPTDHFSGLCGDDGTYRVTYRTGNGLPPGRYRVVVTRFLTSDGKPVPAGEPGEVLKTAGRAVKKSYAFEKEVAAGENPVDFELTQGKEVAE